MTVPRNTGIGQIVYGGTFDPVHIGHLRMAIELKTALGAICCRMIPSADPPHRASPGASATERLAMLQIAISGVPGLLADAREIHRPGKSFTVLTLQELRRELGDQMPVYLVMGKDAWALLDTWHEWRTLLDLAHIVIIDRPGFESEKPEQGVLNWAAGRYADHVETLHAAPSGRVLHLSLSQLDISASHVRALLASGQSANFLVPDPVLDYISAKGLYLNHEDATHPGSKC